MEEILEKNGYDIVSFKETADVYIINTCSVTNMADRKSRQMIHRAKKNNPDAIIVAAGCYVQAAEEELAKKNEADILVGNNKKKDIAQILEEYFAAKEPEQEVPVVSEVIDINHTKEYEDLTIHKVNEHTRAYIKIQDGCNQFCSYCIIPYTRGRIRSKNPEEVIEEVKNLAAQGYKEIVLTGIHLGNYGKDIHDGTSLSTLVTELVRIPDLLRIRLGSIESVELSDELIRIIREEPKVCPHLHLPIQAGSDDILKRMNRHYRLAEYKELVRNLRKEIPGLALTTDLIVGFPGETEENFRETLDTLQELQFSAIHVFPYSPRKGTPAAAYPNQVKPEIKKERAARVQALGKELAGAYRNQFFHKMVRVLVEEEKEGFFEGVSDEYIRVFIKDKDVEKGKVYSVWIDSMTDNGMIGMVQKEEENE